MVHGSLSCDTSCVHYSSVSFINQPVFYSVTNATPIKPSKTSTVSASKMGEEEEDLAVLIYKSSKTAKARAAAAAAAAKEKEQVDAAACMRSRTTSTRKRSITANQDKEASMDRVVKRSASNRKHKFSEDIPKAGRKYDWRNYAKICSYDDGCTNLAQKGGVCIKHGKHGAKKEYKPCSSEGCTNQVKRGGVCIRHGATRKKYKCSSEGCTNQAQKGGLCKRHGATVNVKQCRSEGCTNQAKKGGVNPRSLRRLSVSVSLDPK
jgi:hypothetical protein